MNAKGKRTGLSFGFGLALLMTLAGCSTAPVTEGSATPVPAGRIYAPEMMRSSTSQTAEVVFLRDSGMLGAGCSHDIFVNNRKAFSIRAGESIKLFLDPGEYFFRLETGGGICADVATSQDITLRADSRVAYRLLLPSDMSLRLTRIR